MSKISGYICVRNGESLDFCYREAIESLIPVCDEIVICDSDSTDNTREILDGINDSRLRIINRPWDEPCGRPTWWVEWLNWTREQLKYPFQLTLDADEVLSERAYPRIRQAADTGAALWFARLNFWQDAQHLAPKNQLVGEAVVRAGPADLWMPSDEPHPEGEPELRVRAGQRDTIPDELTIFHYGFLRSDKAMIEKVRRNLRYFFNSKDDRIEQAAEAGGSWREFTNTEWKLQDYAGPHPAAAHKWLQDHGYKIG